MNKTKRNHTAFKKTVTTQKQFAWLKAVFYSMCFFGIPMPGLAQQNTKLINIQNFGTNPGNLKMYVYNAAQPNQPKKPLVIVLHGCTQNAHDAALLTGWNKLATENDFTLLYPQQRLSNNPNLCFNWFMVNDIEKGQGECESIYQMLTYMKTNYAVDTGAIYVTGLSAGAAMGVAMLATHPHEFKAGAIFAGTAYHVAENAAQTLTLMSNGKKASAQQLGQYVTNQNPAYTAKYPVLYVFQGMDDNIVNPNNATLLIHQWTNIHATDTIPDSVQKTYKQIPDITYTQYYNQNNKPVVHYYQVKNLKHQLLVKPGKARHEGGKRNMFSKDIGLHSTYEVAVQFGLIKQ